MYEDNEDYKIFKYYLIDHRTLITEMNEVQKIKLNNVQ